jgi:hypothetical protein
MAIAVIDGARIAMGVFAGFAAFGAVACEPVIDTPAQLSGGVYCLATDVSIGGTPAFVLYGDTTLDCQGHRIRDLTSSTENAIQASGDNVVVKNCVFDGFDTQLSFKKPTNYRIEGNISIGARSLPIYVFDGDQGLVAGNTITAPVQGGDWSGAMIYGPADVVGNTVILPEDPGVGAIEYRIGIHSYDNDGGVVAHNLVKKIVANPGDGMAGSGEGGSAMSVGGRAIVYRNVMVKTQQAYPTNALSCYTLTGSQLQNLAVGWSSPDMSCATQHQTGLKARARNR